MFVMLFPVWALTGCSPAVPPGKGSSPPPPRAQIHSCDLQPSLNIVIDYTGSPVDQAVQEAWANLRQELPGIIDSLNACSVVLWAFNGDGWQWARLKELPLPSHTIHKSSTELTDFGNVRHALDDAEANHVREEIVEALKPLDEVRVSPQFGHEASMSNVVGMLKRVSDTKESGSVFILITDLADSKFRSLPHIDAPTSRVYAVAVLVPSKPKDTVLTLGKDLPGDQQFEIRSRQLRQSASWISVIPYFTRNLLAVVKAEMAHPNATQTSSITAAGAAPNTM